ncbi:hypothetical protein F5Y10DRAFT_37130 [Nemania abortiva]|nr:hypothetical protein F5Y10DRAFT_37130 [Nemania abortiva]
MISTFLYNGCNTCMSIHSYANPARAKLASRSKSRSKRQKKKKHTTPGIRWSSPTQLLIRQYLA